MALRTPLIAVRDRRAGAASSKAESLQPIGAFKIRGAYHAISTLTAEERAAASITHSSGNHAQGVALAARLLGIHAVIVMPSNAPAIKRGGSRPMAPRSSTVGRPASERARSRTAAASATWCSSRPTTTTGSSRARERCGLEIAEDVPDLAAVLVPIGGGGLSSGVAVAVRALRPGRADPRRGAGGRRRRAGVAARGPHRALGLGAHRQHDRGRRAVAGDRAAARLPTCHACSTASSRSPKRRSQRRVRLIAEEARLDRRAVRARSPLPRRRYHANEAGIAGLAGTVVAVVSGGNVDPGALPRDLGWRPAPGRLSGRARPWSASGRPLGSAIRSASKRRSAAGSSAARGASTPR